MIRQPPALADILRVDSVSDYPQIQDVLWPAAERTVCEAVGEAWVLSHADDAALTQLLCVLVAYWFDKPDAVGELTPGANFLITQLQARGAEGGDTCGADG